jgi:hypothetical protein
MRSSCSAFVGGYLTAPETVASEVLRKASQEPRFRPAAAVWVKLVNAKRIEVISDDITDDLASVVERLTLMPMPARISLAKDLGETMVVAHSVVAAQAGQDVEILIDDGAGARMADNERRRLGRLRDQGHAVGSISIYSTISVLMAAGKHRHIADKGQMRRVYEQLRACDDGLVHLRQTPLLSADVWDVE